MSAPPVFRTSRLVVREWRDEDAADVLDLLGRREVSQWTSTPEPMQRIEQAHERMAFWRTAGKGQPGLGIWAITLAPEEAAATGRADDRVVGTLILRPLDEPPITEIGWSLHPEVWGRGYATEAAAATLTRAWEHGHAEVVAIMWPDNHPSAAVAERIGMVDQGTVVDPWYGTDEEPMSRIFRVSRPLG